MNICIFCGSKIGFSEEIRNDIILFCELVSMKGFDLVFGGSDFGTMGLVAEIFRKNGRKIIGIRPEHFIKNEEYLHSKSDLIFTKTMSERKMKMLELSDVIIAFPGGIGTLDEITEAHCLKSIQQNQKFVGILNSKNFFEGLILQYETMKKFGYIKEKKLEETVIEQDPEKLFEMIVAHYKL